MHARERPPQREAEFRTVTMPADTNAYGDIFGGRLDTTRTVRDTSNSGIHMPIEVYLPLVSGKIVEGRS